MEELNEDERRAVQVWFAAVASQLGVQQADLTGDGWEHLRWCASYVGEGYRAEPSRPCLRRC